MLKKKIAVLRANALGDFIFVLPALTALRKTFPNAEIVLLGKAMHKSFLANRPSPVDRVVIVPPYPGVGEAEDYNADPVQVEAFFDQMQREQFDVAIQMHGGGRNSNPFILRLGAKLTVGSKTPDAPALDISIPYTTYFSEILRYLQVVSYLGIRTENILPQLSVTEADLYEAQQWVGSTDQPVAVIQPGASDPRRRWPVENFARVADALIARGFRVCYNGTEDEKEIVEKIIALMLYHTEAQDLSGKVSLSGLTGLLSKATLLISNDTGPLHLAHALQTPAIGIYWVPNMITGTPMTCSHSRPLISWNTNCPLCGAPFSKLNTPDEKCDHNTSFVAEITVEAVLEVAQELLTISSNRSLKQSCIATYER